MEFPFEELNLIPPEAFSFWPSGESVCSGSGKHILRFIFYHTRFSDFESSAIADFKQAIQGKVLPPYYSDEELLRLLIANGFDNKKTIQALNNSIAWRNENLSDGYLSFYNHSTYLLNSGAIYIQGLDHKFRPLIVLNLARMDLKTISVADYSNLLCFTLEFAIKHLMIPGQIENWIVITDLGKYPLLKLPISDLKKLIKVLQDNYKCRMVVNYVVNAPASISLAWGIGKKLLHPQTVKKIKIYRCGQPKEIFWHFARNQIEEQYGGTAPNRTTFWPLILPQRPYHAEGEEPHICPSDSEFSIGSILEEETPNSLPSYEARHDRKASIFSKKKAAKKMEIAQSVNYEFEHIIAQAEVQQVSRRSNEEKRPSFIDKINRIIRNSIDDEQSREALHKAEEDTQIHQARKPEEQKKGKTSCFRKLFFCLCKTD